MLLASQDCKSSSRSRWRYADVLNCSPDCFALQNAPGFCKTPDTLVFEDVTVAPMDKERTPPHRDVLVEGGIIRSVDKHPSQRRWPANSIIVAGEGKYLLRGFSDMHIRTEFGDEQQLKLYIVNGVCLQC